MNRTFSIGATLALLALASPATAQEDQARRDGARLARDLCSECHIVSEGQRGPVIDGVPSFASLARDDRTDRTAGEDVGLGLGQRDERAQPIPSRRAMSASRERTSEARSSRPRASSTVARR